MTASMPDVIATIITSPLESQAPAAEPDSWNG
jgi:hypothetical protein